VQRAERNADRARRWGLVWLLRRADGRFINSSFFLSNGL